MILTKEDILKIDFDTIQNFYNLKDIAGVSIDSRSIKQNEIFFAIEGENFDGHSFVKNVFENGASLVIVNKKWYIKNSKNFLDKPLVVVDDTVKALGQLAACFRSKFHKPVIALTGSNGKTTTKEMIFSVLSEKYNVLRTEGNLNNHIGVPMMIFKMNEKYDIAILEMGTNHFGEIDYLCNIAQPDYGLITNVGHAHLEFFKDLNGVRKAKGELFNYLSKNDKIGFVNCNDKNIVKAAGKLKCRETYGFDGNFNYSSEFLEIKNKSDERFRINYSENKSFIIELSIIGRHNIQNALAAAVIGLKFNVNPKKIQRALKSFKPSSKRMELEEINGIQILNDCYNSNPDSVRAALEAMKNFSSAGSKIIILGDMLELGTQEESEHRKIGKMIKDYGFDKALFYGPLSKYTYKELTNKITICEYYKDKKDLVKKLKEIVIKGDIILLKGSRGMKMETILQDFKNF
jgi:UDP-N-acetylmuramoyl-tripeptide--D-alanyl-D-alanine ligase